MDWKVVTCDPACDLSNWFALLIEFVVLFGIFYLIIEWLPKIRRRKQFEERITLRLLELQKKLKRMNAELISYYDKHEIELKSNILQRNESINQLIEQIHFVTLTSNEFIKVEISDSMLNFCDSVSKLLLKLDNKQQDLDTCTNLIMMTNDLLTEHFTKYEKKLNPLVTLHDMFTG